MRSCFSLKVSKLSWFAVGPIISSMSEKKEQNMKPWINTLFSWCTLFVYDGHRHGKKFLQHAPSFLAIIFFFAEKICSSKKYGCCITFLISYFRFWFWILFFCFFFVKLAKISSMTQGKFLMSVDRWAFLSALGFSRRFTNFEVHTTFEKGNLQTQNQFILTSLLLWISYLILLGTWGVTTIRKRSAI